MGKYFKRMEVSVGAEGFEQNGENTEVRIYHWETVTWFIPILGEEKKISLLMKKFG